MPEIRQEDALRDVRDAYRIVHAYQRRILDTMNLIGDAFPEASFYRWDCHNYSHPPQRGNDIRQYWAWQALPMHAFSVLLTKVMPEPYLVQPGGWMLELAAVADDAFKQEGAGEPDGSGFADAKGAGTKFKLVMWRYDGENSENQGTWYDVWCNNDYPEQEGVGTPIDGQLTVMMRTDDLAALDTLEAVKEAAAEFRRECRETLQLDLPDLQEMT